MTPTRAACTFATGMVLVLAACGRDGFEQRAADVGPPAAEDQGVGGGSTDTGPPPDSGPPPGDCIADLAGATDRPLAVGRLPSAVLVDGEVVASYRSWPDAIPTYGRFGLDGSILEPPTALATTSADVAYVVGAGEGELFLWLESPASEGDLVARPLVDGVLGASQVIGAVTGRRAGHAELPGGQVAVAYVGPGVGGAVTAQVAMLAADGTTMAGPVSADFGDDSAPLFADVDIDGGADEIVLGLRSEGGDVFFRRLDRSLAPMGPLVTIAAGEAADNVKIVMAGSTAQLVYVAGGSRVWSVAVEGARVTRRRSITDSAPDISFDTDLQESAGRVELVWQSGIRSDPGRNGIALRHAALAESGQVVDLTPRDGGDRVDGSLLFDGSLRHVVYDHALESGEHEIRLLTFDCR